MFYTTFFVSLLQRKTSFIPKLWFWQTIEVFEILRIIGYTTRATVAYTYVEIHI